MAQTTNSEKRALGGVILGLMDFVAFDGWSIWFRWVQS